MGYGLFMLGLALSHSCKASQVKGSQRSCRLTHDLRKLQDEFCICKNPLTNEFKVVFLWHLWDVGITVLPVVLSVMVREKSFLSHGLAARRRNFWVA